MTASQHTSPRLHARRDDPKSIGDGLAHDYLAGLVRCMADDVEQARRWHRVIAADAFADAMHRAVFVAVGTTLELCQKPDLLQVKFVITHDASIECDVDDAVNLLFELHTESIDRPYHLWMPTATEKLRHRHHCDQAADLGRALALTAAAGALPTDAEIEDLIQRARRMQIQARNPDASSRDLLSIIDRWKLNKAEKLVPTGLSVIDKAFGGGLPVGVHGIAAKPKTGKSAIAGQMALGALLHDPDASVLWFRGEMTDDLLFSKLLPCWSKMRPEALAPITLRDALHRSPESKPVYLDLATVVGSRFVTVDPPLTVSTIEHHVDQRRPSLVVIDYLQLCESPGFKDRRAELDHMVSRLSMLATRHDVPVLIVSAVAKGTDKDSEIGTLTKESNRLDYDAHTFISLWNDGPTDHNPRKVLMRINASRSGQQRDDELWFHGRHQFFQAASTYAEFDDFAPTVPLP